MFTKKLQSMGTGLFIYMLLPVLLNSSPLPATANTDGSTDSNIISYLNVPGHGKTHETSDTGTGSIDPLSDSIQPLEDLGLNFTVFDAWAKAEREAKQTAINNATAPTEESKNEEESASSSTNSPPPTTSVDQHYPFFFTQNCPLRKIHNTFHRVVASVRNLITVALDQRQREQEDQTQQHHMHPTKMKKINATIITQSISPSSSVNPPPVPTSTEAASKIDINTVMKVSSPSSASEAVEAVENGNTPASNAKLVRSSRLIEDLSMQPANSNNLFMRDNKSGDKSIGHQDDENLIIKLELLPENLNQVSSSNKTDETETNSDASSKPVIPVDQFTITEDVGKTTTEVDLLSSDEDTSPMSPADAQGGNNLFMLPSAVQNKTRAVVAFVVTPLLNLWQFAQRQLPPWTQQFNRTPISEVELDGGSNGTMQTASVPNNLTFHIELSNPPHIISNFHPDRIPALIATLRQRIGLPLLPIHTNHSARHAALRNLYRTLNEKMPFRKYATTSAPKTVADLEPISAIQTIGKKRNAKIMATNDDDDDDDDDSSIIVLNSKEYNDEFNTFMPLTSATASSRRATESVGIYILEIFGTIVGLTWGALSSLQNLFTKN